MAGNKNTGTAPAGGKKSDAGGGKTVNEQVRSPNKAPDAGQPSSQRRD